MNWWQKAESGTARGIEGVGGFIGLSNMANEAQAKRIAAETEYLRSNGQLPALRGAGAGAAGAAPVTNNNEFNITQQPGESTEQLARRIADMMKRDAAVQQRGSLTDH
jgi:hypothetical protein